MEREDKIRETIDNYVKKRDKKLGLLLVTYGVMLMTLFTVLIPIILVFVVLHLHRARSELQQKIDELELELL